MPGRKDDRDGDRLFPAVPGNRSREKQHQLGLGRFRLEIRKYQKFWEAPKTPEWFVQQVVGIPELGGF